MGRLPAFVVATLFATALPFAAAASDEVPVPPPDTTQVCQAEAAPEAVSEGSPAASTVTATAPSFDDGDQALSGGQVLSGGQSLPGGQASPAPDAGGEAKEHGKFADVARGFFKDGAYLFTFPNRVTPRGVALSASWGGATLLALHNDDAIRASTLPHNNGSRDSAAQSIEPLGRMTLQAGVLGILYASGRMADKPGLASAAGTSFEALLWSAMICNVTKMAFGREQPADATDARNFFEQQGSFPSGHAARSFAIAAVMADRYGTKAAWIGYSIAGLVSLSMVQRDIHWMSDVVAGAGLGLAIGKGIAAQHPDPTREARAEKAGPRRLAWQVQPARDGAAVSIVF
jgi:hypothetical protein